MEIGILQALKARMQYSSQQHAVIASNIANADTPGYMAREMKDADFSLMVDKAIHHRDPFKTSSVLPAKTHQMHIQPGGGNPDDFDQRQDKTTYEVTPSGNGVILEEQLVKMNRNASDYTLMTNLYRKHGAMMNTALGRGR